MRSAAPEREAVPLPAPRPRLAEAQVAEVGPAPLVPLSGDDRLLLLQKALQARAKNLVATTLAGPEGTPADGAGPMVTGALGGTRPSAARPEAHSVSFDFKSGVKTIVFADGAVVREPFDVPSLKGLAATETGARPGSAP